MAPTCGFLGSAENTPRPLGGLKWLGGSSKKTRERPNMATIKPLDEETEHRIDYEIRDGWSPTSIAERWQLPMSQVVRLFRRVPWRAKQLSVSFND
jgi:hypothetical protein